MQIKISARHGHLDDATQEHIRDKAGKLLHFFQRIMMIEVLVDLSGDDKLVEFLVSAEHKHDFVASERNANLLAAVDLVLAKLEGQVRKYKEKVQDHRRRPHAGEVTGERPQLSTTGGTSDGRFLAKICPQVVPLLTEVSTTNAGNWSASLPSP